MKDAKSSYAQLELIVSETKKKKNNNNNNNDRVVTEKALQTKSNLAADNVFKSVNHSADHLVDTCKVYSNNSDTDKDISLFDETEPNQTNIETDIVTNNQIDIDTSSSDQNRRNSKMGVNSINGRLQTSNILFMIASKPIISHLLRVPTVADRFKSTTTIYSTILNNPRASLPVLFLLCTLVNLVFILPWYLASLVITEPGVYLALSIIVYILGRFVLRLIAFPGSTHRVCSEIENEFAKYSIRVLDNACDHIIEFTTLLLHLCSQSKDEQIQNILHHRTNASRNIHVGQYRYMDLFPIWQKACIYQTKVFGMYHNVLHCLLIEDGIGSKTTQIHAQSQTHPERNGQTQTRQKNKPNPFLTIHNNNQLVGDIGNLSNITVQAKEDGKQLYTLINKLLDEFDEVKNTNTHALHFNQRNRQTWKDTFISKEGTLSAIKLLSTVTQLKDTLPSFKPLLSSSSSNNDLPKIDSNQEINLDDFPNHNANNQKNSIRNKFLKHIKPILSAFVSILQLLDPPAHTSIFGLDVLRGSVLSRYLGSRQFWVPRQRNSFPILGKLFSFISSHNGKIDVLHIPTKASLNDIMQNKSNISNRRIQNAVLYCNPNAGLAEVATGMSLVGGNISGSLDGYEDNCYHNNIPNNTNSSNDSCWADFYTTNGYDIFLFNYAGFGRSHGNSFCFKKDYKSGLFHFIRRIVFSTFFAFKPTSESLKSDAQSVATHILENLKAENLIIHGESIGGMAAASAGRHISNSHYTQKSNFTNKMQPCLLICDRTFSNLEAVAQRLVGTWAGYVIPILTPLWNTDTAKDFIAAKCKKIVAQDASDAIIHDAASLRAGLALATELYKGSTTAIGKMIDAPLEYRMADWENVGVAQSKICKRSVHYCFQAPVWPRDKKISISDAFCFAACAKRIGKIATQIRKKDILSHNSRHQDEEEGIEIVPIMNENLKYCNEENVSPMAKNSRNNRKKIVEAWDLLSSCDGLTGMPIGMAVKEGYDCLVSWLCSCLIYGSQRITENAMKRINLPKSSECKLADIIIEPSDFDLYANARRFQETQDDLAMYPIPIPTIIDKLIQLSTHKDALQEVEMELQYCINMLEYVVARISADSSTSKSLDCILLDKELCEMSHGYLLNLSCGHNNQYSDNERTQLKTLLNLVVKY